MTKHANWQSTIKIAPKRIYNPSVDYALANIDLLSLLFESSECPTEEETLLHVEAANITNFLTKAQTRHYVKSIAHVLRSRFNIGGLGAGKDVVICISSGQILLPSLFYATIAAGGVYSSASNTVTDQELTRQINHGKATLLVASPDCEELARMAARASNLSPDRILILDSYNGKRSLLDHAQHDLLDPSGKDDRILLDWEVVTDANTLRDRPICLIYSSGTTGQPKGVCISHTNLVSSGLILGYAHRDYLNRRRALDSTFDFQYRTLAHLPTAHIAGIAGYFIHPSMFGGTVYWMPKFNFGDFLKYNAEHRITFFFTVPPVYLQIAQNSQVTDQFNSLHHAQCGAAPIGPELVARAERILGCPISQTWGLSETTGSVTAQAWDCPDRTGSISTIAPNLRMRIVDEIEQDVEDGCEGEFVVQGPTVIVCYWEDLKATARAFTKCGLWLKTGDIGLRRNGKLYILDRKKEIIKYKGIQVAPAELEAVLVSHPLIYDAAVIGVSDPVVVGNEVPRAYVVADRSKITDETIMKFVKGRLASHKQLRGGVIFIDKIPKSANGKILRRVLRDLAGRESAIAKL